MMQLQSHAPNGSGIQHSVHARPFLTSRNALTDEVRMHPLFQISSKGLKRDARRASVTNLAGRAIDLVVQFGVLIILARLITPADFGVFVMATSFLWIIMHFSDLGLGTAVLQQHELTEEHASAVFRINLVAGLAFAGLFLAASPLLGLFYHDPRVTHVAAVLSLAFVFSGLTAVQLALLRRALQFDVLLRAQIIASAVSSVGAVILALMGAGYWALTVRALADPLVYSIVAWSSSGWLPGRAEWDQTTKTLLRYGGYNLGFALLSSAGRQTDSILVGWRFGSVELGSYALASRLFYLPLVQVSWPLGYVMIPALSRLRDDPDRLRRWYSKLLQMVTLVALPPMCSLAICADDVVYLVAGPQWAKSADILRVLGPVGALQVGTATIDWLMVSQGQARRSLVWEAVRTSICIVCVVLGLPWGATGVAAGLAAATLLLFLPSFAYAAKGTSIRLIDVTKALFPSFAVMMATVGAVYLLRVFVAQEWNPVLRLLVTGGAIAGIMVCGAALLYGRSFLSGRFLTSDPE
jgi:PST family polysaccharide transporter